MIEENQNIILLVLILISVLVAFYALYIGLNNGRKLRKMQQEVINLINNNPPMNMPIPIPNQQPKENDEFPSLDEINNEVVDNDLGNTELNPLDDDIKKKIDELSLQENQDENNDADSEDNDEENNIENANNILRDNIIPQEVNVESEELNVESEEVDVENTEDSDEVGEEAEEVEGEVVEVDEGEVVEVDEGGVEEVDEGEVEEVYEGEFNNLENITEEYLNDLNCDQLRKICKRENLRTRGRKNELIERILKKKTVLE